MIAGRHCNNVDVFRRIVVAVVVVHNHHKYRCFNIIIIVKSAKSPSEPHAHHVRDREHQQRKGWMDSLPNCGTFFEEQGKANTQQSETKAKQH